MSTMKGSSSTSLRTIQATLSRVPMNRNFTTSHCSHDASREAESSTSKPRKGQAYPGETPEEAWKRNLSEAREYRRQRASTAASLPLFLPPGSKPAPRFTPMQLSLSTLLASGAALGHSKTLQSSAYTPYIYGHRSGLSIIDLDQTLPIIRRCASLVRDVVKADGVVLFVGTRRGHERIIEKAAERLEDNGFGVKSKWLPGTLTNAETLFGLAPVLNKTYLPDLVIFLNPSENLGAIRECTARNVPTIGIVDTDTDPRIVTYAIPANMDSLRTCELVAGTLSIAGQEGRRLRLKATAERLLAEERRKRSGRDGSTRQ